MKIAGYMDPRLRFLLPGCNQAVISTNITVLEEAVGHSTMPLFVDLDPTPVGWQTRQRLSDDTWSKWATAATEHAADFIVSYFKDRGTEAEKRPLFAPVEKTYEQLQAEQEALGLIGEQRSESSHSET